MPRRSILSATEREKLLALPDVKDELIRTYTLNESDLAIVRQHRGPANRLGFAIQLCYLRIVLAVDESPFPPLLRMMAAQLKVPPESWDQYGQREQTRREHLVELQALFGFQSFTMSHYRRAVQTLTELALQTDKAIMLAVALVEDLRRQGIILPSVNAIERISAEAITRANRRVYSALADSLSAAQRQRLDDLLKRREGGKTTWLAWLRQSPAKPNSRHMLRHIDRLKALQALDISTDSGHQVHQNRLLKMAREGGQMTPADLAKFEPQRRYATLVALVLESTATVIDEIIDLHDRIIGKLLNTAKNRHQQEFQASGKSINEKVSLYGRIGRALLEAKEGGGDPFAAIESVISWADFVASVTEAQKLAQPEDFDFLRRIGDGYAMLRRYAPEFLNALKLRAAPAAKGLLDAVDMLRVMNADNARKVPADAPTQFIKKRWKKLVLTEEGIDRRYYELCVLAELKNALRSGDVWVQGSRQFKDFDDYLISAESFAAKKQAEELRLAISSNCDHYLHERLLLLEQQLGTVNRLAAINDLPDAVITESGLKITPLDAAVPDAAQDLIYRTSMMLPHVKITELLLEVDEWTGFTRHFTHLKTNEPAKDQTLLLTTILADAITEAAETAKVPALQISFRLAVEAINQALPVLQVATPKTFPRLRAALINEISHCRIDRPRRNRQFPRKVKRKMSNFQLKGAADREKAINLAILFVESGLTQ